MLRVKEALKLKLSKKLLRELSKFDLEALLAMDQNGKMYIIPPTKHNLKLIGAQESAWLPPPGLFSKKTEVQIKRTIDLGEELKKSLEKP